MNLTKEDKLAIEALLERTPSLLEEYIFDTMWSEHCSYKSSKDVLKKYLPTKGSNVLLGIGEDAGIVKFAEHEGKKYGIVMAHESHNHPSQVLPIEGAATGVGGIVRDVYCMGADVIGVLDSLHFGLDTDGTNYHVDEIAEGVVAGVSDYANPLGVPVLGGETIYHESYNDNCLVNVGALGILEEDEIIHSRVPDDAKNVPYVLILVGKSTDSTGFGGASFASATLDSDNEIKNVGAVQAHDPFLKRVLAEAIKDMFKVVKKEGIKIGFKDLGAGGIACASSEIAAANNFGVKITLENVNISNPDLLPQVIACSETQERFCIAVPKDKAEIFLNIFNKKFELPSIYYKAGAVIIGEVSNEPFYDIYYQNELICHLPIQAITSEVKAERKSQQRIIPKIESRIDPEYDLDTVFKEILALPNIKSKRYVYRFYDQAVRGDTVIYPGEADSVVITPIQGCNVGLAVNMSSNLYGENDPFTAGAYAVAEAIRNIVAVGAEPLALTDCLNYGNPENPEAFFDFEEGVKGIADACVHFNFIENEHLPIVSGNVSFYNESKSGKEIIPSPVIMAVGRIKDFRLSKSMQIKALDSNLVLLGARFSEFGGTQISQLVQGLNNQAPQVRFEAEAKINKAIYQLINEGRLLTVHDISMGGLYVSLVEMLLGERGNFKFGVEINIQERDALTVLFSENGGFLLEVNDANLATVQTLCNNYGIYWQNIGKIIKDKVINLKTLENVYSLGLNELNKYWQGDLN
ncbi:MAG: phosphoribosylformylglycinamidine synthase subunit PurL [Candidatus Margulisiibacteriota bacterium]|jgi:phosphoribosylformylglycinamidine synthase